MKLPYMQFYVSDYMNDSKVKVLSLAAQGLYVRVLACLWLEKEPFLPCEPELVAKITGIQLTDFMPAWLELWRPGYELFTLSKDGIRFTQKRLRMEWETAEKKGQVRSNAQKESVISRKNNKKTAKNTELDDADKDSDTNTAIANDLAKGIAKPLQKIAILDSDTDTDTDSDTDSDTDTEKELKDKKTDTLSPAVAVVGETSPPTSCPHIKIIELYHKILPELPQVVEWTETRRKMLAQRWKEKKDRQSLDWWKSYFLMVKASNFLTGKTEGRNGGAPFLADLEWIIRPSNMTKILEGKYKNRKSKDIYDQAAEAGFDECIQSFFGDSYADMTMPKAKVISHG